jgi:hypothetical protein
MTKIRETLETISATADARLYVLGCDAYKAGTPRDMVRTVRGNADLLMALVIYYLENRIGPDMRGDTILSGRAGQPNPANDGYNLNTRPAGNPAKDAGRRKPGDPPPPSSLSPGSGQGRHAIGHTHDAPFRRKPNPPRGLGVIASVNRTLFDTFTVRGGKAIGDLTLGEARSLAVTNEREARVLRVVCAHVAFTAEPGAPLRQLVPLDLIERAVAQNMEASDEAR